MRHAAILLLGVVFGVTLYKGEVVSWFRIQEMFRFQSVHMYGVIGSAVLLGALGLRLFKMQGRENLCGEPSESENEGRWGVRHVAGGIVFGLGWGLIGACPGPMFILVGSGASVFLVAVVGALLGTFVYGLLRSRLPH
jgi:uncharacterized membrane protein YedE/YeeE